MQSPRSGVFFGLSIVFSALISIGTLGVAVGSDDGPRVVVDGGADVSGQVYTWTVTNRSTSPITRVEFPHYRASMFFAPSKWSVDCTFLVNVGVEDSPGVCVATTPTPTEGIAPGRSSEFSLQCSASGARRGTGVVRVRFADETDYQVTGVELPQPEGAGDKYVPLIGLAAIAGVFAIFAVIRGRGVRRGAE